MKNSIRISIITLCVLLIVLVFYNFMPVKTPAIYIPTNQPGKVALTDGRQCYVYSHDAEASAPYTVRERLDITIVDTKVTGMKSGTQEGPDMTNGYTGSITGTLSDNTITDIFAYTIEGSKNKEQEIYTASATGLEKLRYPLIDKGTMLVPDTTKEATPQIYARVECEGSN